MAYTVRTITYDIFEVVDSEPGHWCDRCMLPSAHLIHLATQVRGGPLRLTAGRRCFDCGTWF